MYRIILLTLTVFALIIVAKQPKDSYTSVKVWAFQRNDPVSTLMDSDAKWIDNSPILGKGMTYHRLSQGELQLAEKYSYEFMVNYVMLPFDYFRVTSRYFRQFFGYTKNGRLFVMANFYQYATNTYLNDDCGTIDSLDAHKVVINPYKKNTVDNDYVLLMVDITQGKVWIK